MRRDSCSDSSLPQSSFDPSAAPVLHTATYLSAELNSMDGTMRAEEEKEEGLEEEEMVDAVGAVEMGGGERKGRGRRVLGRVLGKKGGYEKAANAPTEDAAAGDDHRGGGPGRTAERTINTASSLPSTKASSSSSSSSSSPSALSSSASPSSSSPSSVLRRSLRPSDGVRCADRRSRLHVRRLRPLHHERCAGGAGLRSVVQV